MRRHLLLKNRKLLAGPYLFWSVSFIIIPLLMIFYYGLTDKEGTCFEHSKQNPKFIDKKPNETDICPINFGVLFEL